MKIYDIPISEIKPYENNPRNNDEAVKYVANSIEEFGFKVPIILDSNNEIVAGHTRYKAAKRLKLLTVPCLIADDLTSEQIKAFRLADNKVSEFSEWNLDALDEELDKLNIDMTEFGFDLQDAADEESEDIQEVATPLPRDSCNVQQGDIYQLGDHRLMCGDSTSEDDVYTLMGGE